MICPSCGNRFLQPFVCTICFYNVRRTEAARPNIDMRSHAESLELALSTIRAATVEECAKVCDDALGDYAKADELADAIRALLKEKNHD